MFSISKKGFPDFLFSKSNSGLLKAKSALAISLGEIDVRAHLSKDGSDTGVDEWIVDYILKVRELTNHLEPICTILVGPVPPSPNGVRNPKLPIVGTLDRRIHFTSLLEVALEENIKGFADLLFIPLSPLLANTDGILREEFVLDGIHTSEKACEVIAEKIDRIIENTDS
jgi:hypothetical protein